MEKIFRLLGLRLRSKSPKLFKVIAIGSAIIGAGAATVALLPIALPAWATAAMPLVISASAGIGSVSILTTEDEKIIKETNELFQNNNKNKQYPTLRE